MSSNTSVRYVDGFPFELLLEGFNKAVLVHQDHFEEYVLDSLPSNLESIGVDGMLCRTDINKFSRIFFVRWRPEGSGKRYGVNLWGEKFYIKSTEEL